jgi:decaprenylphospho-beta-D-erythro-pentofuranosid-2-ulose 2-reductase
VKDALGRVESVLVLGGGSEIGLATARALVGRGTRRLVLAARAPGRLEADAAALRSAGAEVALEPWDADDVAGHEAAIAGLFDRHGDLDVVLAVAGVLDGSPAEVIGTNFLGLAATLAPAAERLRGQGHGTIVVLSSVAGERARRSNYLYGSSKAGLDAFAQGLGDALAGSGIGVLVVRPGFVHTKMTAGLDPAPLATTPDKVADAIVTGLARGSHTVWVPGVLRWVMSVLRHLPRPLFRRLEL